jgi:hypothetical protein
MFLLREKTERRNWNYFYRFYFTPVKNVKYSIENFRVEQKTDYEVGFEIKLMDLLIQKILTRQLKF